MAVDWVLAALVALATLASAPLAGVALAALVRRRSRPYLLVALALAALVARSLVAAGTAAGVVPYHRHHLLEHGLDVAMAALVVAAVYHARAVARGRGGRDDAAEEAADD